MPANALAKDAPPLIPEHITALLQQASTGDSAAAATLRRLLDGHPGAAGVWREVADMAWQADQALIRLCTGKDELSAAAMRRKLAAMHADLAGEGATPLEQLLVQRVTSCWLALSHAEATYYQSLANLTSDQDDVRQRRIDCCHKRYLASIRALAVVRRLQVPVVQLNIGERQVNVAVKAAPAG